METHFDKYFLIIWRGFSGLDGVTAESLEEEEEVEAWMVGQEEYAEEDGVEFFTLLRLLVLLALVVSGLDLTNESPDKSTMLRQGLERKVL